MAEGNRKLQKQLDKARYRGFDTDTIEVMMEKVQIFLAEVLTPEQRQAAEGYITQAKQFDSEEVWPFYFMHMVTDWNELDLSDEQCEKLVSVLWGEPIAE